MNGNYRFSKNVLLSSKPQHVSFKGFTVKSFFETYIYLLKALGGKVITKKRFTDKVSNFENMKIVKTVATYHG